MTPISAGDCFNASEYPQDTPEVTVGTYTFDWDGVGNVVLSRSLTEQTCVWVDDNFQCQQMLAGSKYLDTVSTVGASGCKMFNITPILYVGSNEIEFKIINTYLLSISYSWTGVDPCSQAYWISTGASVALAGLGAGGLVCRSTDIGNTWDSGQQLGTQNEVGALADLGGGVAIAGTYPGGMIYRTTDYGVIWTLVYDSTDTRITSLASLGNSIAVAGSDGASIYRSVDNGATWAYAAYLSNAGMAANIYSLENLGDGIVLAGTYPSSKIFRSTDYGKTWKYAATLKSGNQGVISLTNVGGGIVIAGTGLSSPEIACKVYRSMDYGLTWDAGQQLGTETNILSLESLRNNIVLAGTQPTGNIYRSADSGSTWDSGQRPGGTNYVHAIADFGRGVTIASPDVLIYKSTDYGNTWILSCQDTGLPYRVYSLMVFDAEKPLIVYKNPFIAKTALGDMRVDVSR